MADWPWVLEVVVPHVLLYSLLAYIVGMIAAAKYLGGRQPFKFPICGCFKHNPPVLCCVHWRCCFVMCFPCVQWFRMAVLLWGRGVGCAIACLSIICAPCACVLCQLCSCSFSICTRVSLRKRLQRSETTSFLAMHAALLHSGVVLLLFLLSEGRVGLGFVGLLDLLVFDLGVGELVRDFLEIGLFHD